MMIKLHNIEKVFHPHKRNEHTILKNINLEFESKGMVVLLGESGSGKTTLLNMMSGMDKPSRGTIQVKDKTISKYHQALWTDIRNFDVGYVYQNYLLKKDETVYDNIAFSLKICSEMSEKDIDKRVQYVLNQVGLKDMGQRYATQLSGGQKQRVAIARALVNNPEIILADEPTGNIDSKTSIDIMNIFKEIAKDKLVVLVTHETALATFYADRIIHMSSGRIIKDELNDQAGELSVIQEHIIYLKDYHLDVQTLNNTQLIVYDSQEQDVLDQIGVTLIKRHNTLYVKVDSNTYKRIKFINDDSEIVLKDCHFDDDVLDVTSFNYKTLELETKAHQPLSLKESIKETFKHLKDVKMGGKMLYVVLGIIGVLVSVSVGLIGHVRDIDPSQYAEFSDSLLTVRGREWHYDDIQILEASSGVEYVNLITEPVTYRIETEPYYQIINSIELEAHPMPLKVFDEETLIYGNIPDEYGVIISENIADELIRQYGDRGIESYDDIVTMSFKLQTSGHDFYMGDNRSLLFPITGINNDPSKTVYMQEELMYSLILPNMVDYRILGDGLTITQGHLPETLSQLVMSEANTKIRHEVPSMIGISSGWYGVSGTYIYEEDEFEYDTNYLNLTHVDYLKNVYFNTTKSLFINFDVFVHTLDVAHTQESLTLEGYNVSYDFDENEQTYQAVYFEENIALYITSLVGFIVGAISIFFIMRSSLLSRIYDIALYRALGVRKKEIYKMFTVEIVIRATFSALIGYVLMMILLVQTQSSVVQYVRFVYYPLGLTLLGGLALYTSLLIFGLLPIALEMRKTPATLFRKYDL